MALSGSVKLICSGGEGARQQGGVLPAKGAERVVIGVRVGAEHAHGHAVVGGPLDLAAAESARGVAPEEPPEQERRRVLLAAGAAPVHPRRAQVARPHRLQHERHKVILRHPLPQVRRQQQRRVPVHVHEFHSQAPVGSRGLAKLQQAARRA